MTDITVVVPMYNEADHARAVIEAIYSQSVPASVEVIVCNDASTDRTGEVLEQLAHENHNLRVIHNRENRGLANTLARLTATASGEYLVHIDGDTILQPGALETLYTELSNGADMVLGHIAVWDPGTIHERIMDGLRDPRTNPSWGGACVGIQLDTFRESGGWTLRDGGHRNDETTELRRRAAANGWDTRYLNQTVAKTKFPTDWTDIAKRKYRHQWLRNVVGPNGGINWHLFGSPAYWTAVLGAGIATVFTPVAWAGVAVLGFVWAGYQFGRATQVAMQSGQRRDIPLAMAYQFVSGLLRTAGFYAGVLQWPFRYRGEDTGNTNDSDQ